MPLALAAFAITTFMLSNYAGITTVVHAGGYLGLIVAVPAAHLSHAEGCEASCGHPVLPVWPLAGH